MFSDATMQESYLKGPCENCGAHIEFPAQGLGQSIPCPHCGENTNLLQSDAPSIESSTTSNSQKRRRPILLIALSCLALIAAMAFGIFAARKNAVEPEKTISETKVEDLAPQNAPAKKQPAPKSKKAAATPDFESNNLQAFRVTLEKSENSRLIYATGAIRNQSNRQRFGVKVELDLLDEQGAKLGSATDYAQIIEPRKEWKFRAMVTEPKAASVKITAITEE